MKSSNESIFKRNYQKHQQHLKLKGLPPKTIEAYSRAIRQIRAYFNHDINDLSEQPLSRYFYDRLGSHSWSTVKLDLYGLKFYYQPVLHNPWLHIDLIKPPLELHCNLHFCLLYSYYVNLFVGRLSHQSIPHYIPRIETPIQHQPEPNLNLIEAKSLFNSVSLPVIVKVSVASID